jgi:hypothetical protein
MMAFGVGENRVTTGLTELDRRAISQ